VVDAAGRHSRTPAQIVLRWHVQQGLIPIPKTSNPVRLSENIDVFDFELTAEELDAISALDRNGQGAVDSDRIGH
jgi:2,5-diketo-D-gluconate reductase A